MFFVSIDIDKCQACEECMDTCPVDGFEIVEEDGHKYAQFILDPDECIGCMSCEEVCEEGSITITEM